MQNFIPKYHTMSKVYCLVLLVPVLTYIYIYFFPIFHPTIYIQATLAYFLSKQENFKKTKTNKISLFLSFRLLYQQLI